MALLAPGFLLIAVLPIVGRFIIPFYRQEIRMSAYEYFEQRSGRPARLYGAFAFSLAHFSKIGFVLYLMAVTLSSLTGWDIVSLIIGVALGAPQKLTTSSRIDMTTPKTDRATWHGDGRYLPHPRRRRVSR